MSLVRRKSLISISGYIYVGARGGACAVVHHIGSNYFANRIFPPLGAIIMPRFKMALALALVLV